MQENLIVLSEMAKSTQELRDLIPDQYLNGEPSEPEDEYVIASSEDKQCGQTLVTLCVPMQSEPGCVNATPQFNKI